MHREDIVAFGYKEMEHSGFSWLATKEGMPFIIGVDDWSPRGIAVQKGWKSREKSLHEVYLARDQEGMRYLVKIYPPKRNCPNFFSRRVNRAKNEFSKTLLACKKEIQTVLPLAVAQGKEDKRWGIIIYPFLDQAIPLERVYDCDNLSLLSIRERQLMEKTVGRLLRKFIDEGAYPVDAHLDHFLIMKSGEASVHVHYVDLERIGFNSLTKSILKRRKLLKTLGRLIARLEWLRVSGFRINRPSMMRMGRAFLEGKAFGISGRRLRRAVIQAAREFWYRREFHTRGQYRSRSRGLPYSFDTRVLD
ncbi:MAG: hypothetical protein V3U06_01800 [Candidatus Binatia bacterium]